jgi:hypothetical protein
MKSILWTSLLGVWFAFAVVAESTDIGGHWTVRFAGGVAWKTIGGAEFDFRPAGGSLTGMANVGHGYPGKAPIANGKIEGDRISFTVYGQQESSSGFPKMHFTGTIHADEIKLTMVLDYGGAQQEGRTEFEGKRDFTRQKGEKE